MVVQLVALLESASRIARAYFVIAMDAAPHLAHWIDAKISGCLDVP